MDTNTPHCDAPGTFTSGQVRTDPPVLLQFPWAAHPSWAHRDVIQLVVGHGLLHHVWLLCCPWHRHREPCEGGHRTPSAAAAMHLQTEPCPRVPRGTSPSELPTVTTGLKGTGSEGNDGLIHGQATDRAFLPATESRGCWDEIPFRIRYT